MTGSRPSIYILLVVLIFSLCAPALAGDRILDRQKLAAIFTERQLAHSPWPPEDLAIRNFDSAPAQISVPDGSLNFEVINQNPQRFLGRKYLTLLVKVDGETRARVKMWADVELYGNVVLVARRLARHETISAADLSVVRRNITMFGHELVTSPAEAIGQGLKTSLGAGTILLKKHLSPPTLVERGDQVTIQARSKNLQIVTKGEARGQGAAGETIEVKNLRSRQVISARVVDRGLVRVDL